MALNIALKKIREGAWSKPNRMPPNWLPGARAGERAVPEQLTRVWAWVQRHVRPELVALVVVAAGLNLWDLSRNGWANDYYAAAVRSMTMSWHNFLFASFDPSGVMTVDKPPLALWVEALSARIFGFNSWAILVPQALMGTATVALVYDLVRRPFGSGQHLEEEGIAEVADDQAVSGGAAAPQRLGLGVGTVPKLGRGRQDPPAGILRHPGLAVESEAHRGD